MSDLQAATGLAIGSPILAEIRAENQAGWGDYSPEPSVYPDTLVISSSPQSAPQNVHVISYTKNTITI